MKPLEMQEKTAVERLCAECGNPITEPGPSGRPRTKFCSTRCSLRFHSKKNAPKRRQRDRAVRQARQAVVDAAEALLKTKYSYGVGRVTGVEINWYGWGSNDHRPYGQYNWVTRV